MIKHQIHINENQKVEDGEESSTKVDLFKILSLKKED